jgi:tRNA modification GTPase
LRLFVLDASYPQDAEAAAAWPGPDTILVANKIDLLSGREKAAGGDCVLVSALTGQGIAELIARLTARIAENYDGAAPLLTRARHREALEEAADALRRSLAAGLPELRAEDLRLAWRSLGRITGRVDVEDLLDVIFADFCLGK